MATSTTEAGLTLLVEQAREDVACVDAAFTCLTENSGNTQNYANQLSSRKFIFELLIFWFLVSFSRDYFLIFAINVHRSIIFFS